MMRKTLLTALAVLTLTACASGGTQTQVSNPMPEAALMVPPPSLPDPESGMLPDLAKNHRQVAKIYHELADRYRSLLDWIIKTDGAK